MLEKLHEEYRKTGPEDQKLIGMAGEIAMAAAREISIKLGDQLADECKQYGPLGSVIWQMVISGWFNVGIAALTKDGKPDQSLQEAMAALFFENLKSNMASDEKLRIDICFTDLCKEIGV